MKKSIWVIALLCLVIAFGCHSRKSDPKASKEVKRETQKAEKEVRKDAKKAEADTLPEPSYTGKKPRINVLMDIGGDDLTQPQREQREHLNDFMGKDLVRTLDKAGYEASLISDRSQYIKGTYLLKVTIVKYNPGSKAARIVVGFGAGAVSLDTRYELFAPGGNLLVSDDHGVGSSMDWTFCARKLNKQTVSAVSGKLK
ncbi:MAG: DUF4410 domain-containing protein [Proteobacteria bacterium]|nr:DUF4410 domain-containing protein [Pseudomonadota bacterium]